MKDMSRIKGKTLNQKPTLTEQEDFEQRMRCCLRKMMWEKTIESKKKTRFENEDSTWEEGTDSKDDIDKGWLRENFA